MIRSVHAFAILLILAAPLGAQRGDRPGEEQPPLPRSLPVPPSPVRKPEEELATFKLAPGFHAELVASDPLIGDPVAIQFGPDGRMWVLEMRGYMPNAEGEGEQEAVGVVAVLEDTDSDGRHDKRTVFVDRLVMPRALALIGDGVLVSEPPHLWFFRDMNGDGVADEKTEIASDYGTAINPEHDANGLMRAMDNWIYSAKHTTRFRWEGAGRFARETTAMRGQWGITQDDSGRLFYNLNSEPLRMDVIPSAYLGRNPNFIAAGANVPVVPAALRLWPGRVTPGLNRGYKTLDEHGKMFAVTAACGPVIYRGALFPPEFRGDAFVAEPAGNLIKRIKLTEKDGVIVGTNAYEGTEFMTSTDERFRPVNLFNGPDGALYVVDFYRGILQHRTYLTSFLRNQIDERDLAKGIHLGRIWRIVPDGAPKITFKVDLARASTAELVENLSDANGWVRDTAQRLLVERRGPARSEVAERAAALARNPATSAVARLHALWTLEGVAALGREIVLTALADQDDRVCATAVRLAESFLAQPDGDLEVEQRLVALVGTRTAPAVRLQLALTLGTIRTSDADAALRALVVAAGHQPFLAGAVVSGIVGRELEFAEALSTNPRAGAHSTNAVQFSANAVLKTGDAARIDRLLALVTAKATPEWARSALLAGVRHFLPKSPDGRPLTGRLPAEPKPLVAFAANTNAPSAATARSLLDRLTWPGKAGAPEVIVRPLTADEQASFDRGRVQFATLCAACHQLNGQGLAGLAPSLLHSQWVLGDPQILACIVLAGKARENSVMPAWKAALADEGIAGVLTFIRRAWGHDSDPISAATVAEARAATVNRDEPYSDAELDKLLQERAPANIRN